ncbi:Ig-like domain-containing protein [Rahnella woolbedingensis]|uniref:Ig-like domain repeat protein n=1 Tax=Rahnella woolbedingensis TaxID=1510574 RepID=A0A419N214_9GAMM|nr:Ig-like domain-containing protein [Rahnella woolbedingensis]RJT32672.1 Ig-like domain repeat protein [Rahnella woolbedingensis]
MSSTKNNNLNAAVDAGIDSGLLANIDSIMDYVGHSIGPVLNDGYTDDLQPTLSGRLPMGEGQLLRVYCNNVVVGYADIGTEGHWTFKPATPLEPGKAYDFQVVLLDSSGNELQPSNTYTIHTTELNHDAAADAPVITEVFDHAGDHQGPVAQGGKTDDKQPTVSGTADAGDVVTVKVYSAVHNHTYTLGSVVADADGHWSYKLHGGQNITATLGEWTFTATATNVLGTSDSSAGYSVETVASNADDNTPPDTTPPDQPTINTLHDDAGNFSSGATTDDSTPTLQGHAEANSIVKVYEGSTLLGSTTAHSDGTWSYTTPARPDGKHDFTATATDAAGNTSAHSADFVMNVLTVDASGSDGFEGVGYVYRTFDTGAVWQRDSGLKITVENTGNDNGSHMPTTYNSSKFTTGVHGLSRLEFGEDTNYVHLSVDSIYHHDSQIEYYNFEGDLLETQNIAQTIINPNGYYSESDYSYEAPAGESISYVLIRAGSFATSVDEIDWGSESHTSSQQSALLTSHDAVDHHDIMTLAQVDDSHKSTAAVDITDHVQNTLHLTLNDILSEAHPNLFVQDGRQQLAVTGDQGDVVELKVDDLAHNTWQDSGAVTAGGIQYEVYQHAGSNVELLVQHGLELHQVS